jgi:hypothetical protein
LPRRCPCKALHSAAGCRHSMCSGGKNCDPELEQDVKLTHRQTGWAATHVRQARYAMTMSAALAVF